MVGVKRLELPASSLCASCGSQNCLLALASHNFDRYAISYFLYLPQAAVVLDAQSRNLLCSQKKEHQQNRYSYGRSEETRTPGILLPKQARYQLRYTPIIEILSMLRQARFLLQHSRLTRNLVILLVAPLLSPRFICRRQRFGHVPNCATPR